MTNIPLFLPQFYIGNALTVYHFNFMNRLILHMDYSTTEGFRHNIQILSFVFGKVAKIKVQIRGKPPKKQVFLIEQLYHVIKFLYWKPMCDSDKILIASERSTRRQEGARMGMKRQRGMEPVKAVHYV